MSTGVQARFTFPKEVRLRCRSEFLRVQDRGAKITADCLLCLALPNGRADGLTRLGLTVSSKVGNAVVRNRIRRFPPEVFRVRRSEMPPGFDVVFIARPSAANAETPRLTRAFERATQELHKKSVQRPA